MRTITPSVTAASFERVFLRCAHEKNEGGAGWREIARKAIKKGELGEALRRAIMFLPLQYRAVLFLCDVKNLDAHETSWLLGITTGAVRARLRRARIQLGTALASSLVRFIKRSSPMNLYQMFPTSQSEAVAIQR